MQVFRNKIFCNIAQGIGASLALAATPALGQNAATPGGETDRPTNIVTLPPKGFEDIAGPIQTQFDVSFQGRQIGAFDAIFSEGKIRFLNPQALLAAMGDQIDRASVEAFIAQPLDANERLRCSLGQSPIAGCGSLPPSMSGVIVNPETFSVTLFLGREYFLAAADLPIYLGPPSSGPSLLQSARLSLASIGSGQFSYGGTFDTLASIGKTSLVAQTTISDFNGLNTREAYLQHVWSERRAAAGLLQDFSSLTFTNYRLIGAEFASFYGTRLDLEAETASPLEVLLPRRAQVEVYREGVLLFSGRYEAGLQLIDTAGLPTGSYVVQIIARDGEQVLLDQTRSFVKLSTGIPRGKTQFKIRVGERVQDSFLAETGQASGGGGFFPKRTGELVISASASRRIGRTSVGGLTITSFNSRVFGEASVTLVQGPFSALLAAGLGAGGSYSAYLSGTAQFKPVSFFVSARTVRASDTFDIRDLDRRYQPFFRSQDTIFASAQTKIGSGSLSVTGSYSRSKEFPDRYAIGAQFSRTVDLPHIGDAVLTASATKSDFDTRFGISLSFFGRLDRKTSVSYNAGAQYVANSVVNGRREGFSPVAQVVATRSERVGIFDLTGTAGASTDSDGDRFFAEARTQSPLGSADATVQLLSRNRAGNGVSYLANLETGFALSGGAVKFGIRNPSPAAAMIDLEQPRSSEVAQGGRGNLSTLDDTLSEADNSLPKSPSDASSDVTPPRVAEGGYRIVVDGQPYDYIEPGRRVIVGLPAFGKYNIALRPEGAPQFDLDVTERSINLYPGNVAQVRFEAQRIATFFGQILDRDGKPLAQARVSAETDYVVADDLGYFTISGPIDGELIIRKSDGSGCSTKIIKRLFVPERDRDFYRTGPLFCEE